MTASKAFLRTFIRRIEIEGDQATIRYTLPVPPHGVTNEKLEILPIDTPSGTGGTISGTFEFSFRLTF